MEGGGEKVGDLKSRLDYSPLFFSCFRALALAFKLKCLPTPLLPTQLLANALFSDICVNVTSSGKLPTLPQVRLSLTFLIFFVLFCGIPIPRLNSLPAFLS